MLIPAKKIVWWLWAGAALGLLTAFAPFQDGKDFRPSTGTAPPRVTPTPVPAVTARPRPTATPRPTRTPSTLSPTVSSRPALVTAYTYNRVQYPNRPFLLMPSAEAPGQLSPDRLPVDGKPLLAEQIKKLPASISRPGDLPDSPEPFHPEYALVFYTKTGQIERVMEISLGEARAQEFRISEFRRHEVKIEYSELATLLYKLKLPLSAEGNSDEEYHRSLTPQPARAP